MVSFVAQQPGFLFGICAALAWIAHRLRAPFVVLLLLGGALFGRDGFGFWQGLASFESFASFGIAALLFLVGLELSPAFFREVGLRPVRLFANTFLALGILGVVWVRAFDVSLGIALLLGVLFTFNSTALALKTLGERDELGKTHGRLAMSVLILQDVVGSVLFAVLGACIALLQSQSMAEVASLYLIKVVVLCISSWMFAKYALAKVWRQIAKRPEVFLLAGFAYPLFVGTLFSLFGLSAELGALVAGISLAQSEYRFELIARMKPLKEIFLAPFFFLMGAGWAWRATIELWPFILLGLMIVSVFGPLLVFASLYRSGISRASSLATALALSHGGEFVLIFLAYAQEPLGLSRDLTTALLSVVIFSMMGGALLLQASPSILAWMKKRWPERGDVTHAFTTSPHIVLFGCHRVGSDFLPVLQRKRVPFVVVDSDPEVVEHLQQHNIQALFGDITNRELLSLLAIERAQLIISTVPDVEAQVTLLKHLKSHHAKPVVILVAHDIKDALLLYKEGASYVILPHFLGGNYASQLVETHGFDSPEPFEVERLRHVEHLKKRGASRVFLPVVGRGR